MSADLPTMCGGVDSRSIVAFSLLWLSKLRFDSQAPVSRTSSFAGGMPRFSAKFSAYVTTVIAVRFFTDSRLVKMPATGVGMSQKTVTTNVARINHMAFAGMRGLVSAEFKLVAVGEAVRNRLNRNLRAR